MTFISHPYSCKEHQTAVLPTEPLNRSQQWKTQKCGNTVPATMKRTFPLTTGHQYLGFLKLWDTHYTSPRLAAETLRILVFMLWRSWGKLGKLWVQNPWGSAVCAEPLGVSGVCGTPGGQQCVLLELLRLENEHYRKNLCAPEQQPGSPGLILKSHCWVSESQFMGDWQWLEQWQMKQFY
jgi:hypothetical protein